MNKIRAGIALLALLLFGQTGLVHGFERRSRQATLHYPNQEILAQFNERLSLGRALTSRVHRREIVTLEDEVIAKVDTIIDKARLVLAMFPDHLHITVVVLADDDAVGRLFRKRYGRPADHIAYYSLSEDTIYISAADASLEVFSHEVGHAVVDHYFQVRPPYDIHELMAQFTARHILD